MKWLIVLCVVVVCACGGDEEKRWPIDTLLPQPRLALDTIADPQLVSIALGADRAEVGRIEVVERTWEIREVAPPRPLSPAELARLQEILGQPRFQPPQKPCGPSPGVRVRFHRGDATVDLLLCYECRELLFAPPPGLPEPPWFEFDLQEPALVAWARRVFPDDAAFRGSVNHF